ncbi:MULTISPECIES: hypothetical protein [Fischerella]|uniref:Uncharacterized protein n=1 Tax=Fischerella muscicola CCMEE 5323 TaxID=2019572 RepID=A0A2N6JW23_FISMU|nr:MULTISPECIES: hypothetical protein [Fischerella]PLZ83795.1 hypothetical protein CEN44_26055 [Fischerella muscicola CCMEE 5323]
MGNREMGRWGGGELGVPTPPREWGLGAVGRWGVGGKTIVTNNHQLTTNNHQPTTNYQQPTTNNH